MSLQKACLLLSCAIALFACNANYKKTKEGMAYKIFAQGKGEKFKQRQFLKVYYSTKVGDSLLESNFGKVPAYGMFDTSAHGTYEFVDFLGEMRVGDSAVYTRSVDTMVKRGTFQYNNFLKKGALLNGSVKVLATFASESEVRADQEKELALEKQREIAGLEKFMAEQRVKPTSKTAGGVLVVMENEGSGLKADSGCRVTVNYTGRLKSGAKFDSNVDTAFGHVQPLEFQVGARAVIPGWDEGLMAFKEGGKGKLYVPAMMAYGMQSQGEKLPAFSDLIFDIEVLKVLPATSTVAPGINPNAAQGKIGQ